METFNALAEPARRRLLETLRHGEQPVSALVSATGMSQPAVSKHLRILREVGLVSMRPDGQRRWYRLEAAPLKEVDAWLAPYRRFWADRLDALQGYLNAAEAPPDGGRDSDRE